MKSWNNWLDLKITHIKKIPKGIQGVYVIRKKNNLTDCESDIIYIGKAGGQNIKQGIKDRLTNLKRDMDSGRNKSRDHNASQKIKKYKKDGLQFSWVHCYKNPDGVEKSLLLGFLCSTGRLPVCNSQF
jgi:hypothetical protein